MESSTAPALVWFRQDLRRADNPALAAAAKTRRPLALLYVLDDETPGHWAMGGASRWWLHHSLDALSADLARHGARLVLRRGLASEVVPAFAAEVGAAEVFWNRCYEPYAIARDAALKAALTSAGCTVHSFNGALLREPWEVRTGQDGPFKVFTPFWRALRQMGPPRQPLPAPAKLSSVAAPSDVLETWSLTPRRPNWARGFAERWTPGEAGARTTLKRFVDQRLAAYPEDRDFPARDGASRLSPHLHWGEISPVQVWAAAESHAGADKFLSELGWREFSTHLLFNAPDLPQRAWRQSFEHFPWRADDAAFRAWTIGRTGYPLVDAGMRELWATGAMHNRVRMVAASFLIKHLLIDWRRGQDWFWDTLVDADLANNAASWQWVAGSGADASPYFRIFNPAAQGARFDAEGAYIRRWVPELAALPDGHIHTPSEAPPAVLAEAGVRLGDTYPTPIVEHAAARARALAAFEHVKAAA